MNVENGQRKSELGRKRLLAKDFMEQVKYINILCCKRYNIKAYLVKQLVSPTPSAFVTDYNKSESCLTD